MSKTLGRRQVMYEETKEGERDEMRFGSTIFRFISFGVFEGLRTL